jgi:hypothetical protein
MINLIAPGEPGERWYNDTGIVYWQLECSLINTCGNCFQFHMQIAEAWFIPLHRCCRCRTIVCPPGELALPWANYIELLKAMDESQHEAAVGKYNWRLINENIVKWSDVVTSGRVRTFEQVIAREKLTIAELIKAGIPRGIAEENWAKVHTPAHEAFQQKITGAVKELRKAGLTDDEIAKGFAEQLVPRIMGGVPKEQKGKHALEHKPAINRGFTGKSTEKRSSQPMLAGLGMTPQEQIAAANKALAKLGDTEGMPDFAGSTTAMRAWVKRTFPDAVISDEDWLLLVLAVAAQKELRKTFQTLGVDPDKGMKAMGQ